MNTIGRMLTAAVIALGLTGCGNGVVVSNVDISQGYSTLELARYGTGGNELRVDVSGDPFGDGDVNAALAVVDAMKGRRLGQPIAFAVEPEQEAQPPSRVVLFINGRRLVGSETLCDPQSPITTSRTEGGAVRISGAWCQTNFVITSVDARVGAADSLSSEAFQALMTQFTIALFPPQNAHRAGRGRCGPLCF